LVGLVLVLLRIASHGSRALRLEFDN
jgi:hypothetical protein